MSAIVIHVRAARASDAEALARVHDAAWREAYAGIIPGLALERMVLRRGPVWWADAARRRSVLVIEVAREVAGYATLGRARLNGSQAAGEIHELYLAPEYQGLGFGVRLFEAATREFRSRRMTRMIVRALADNERAVEFYRRRGGRIVGSSEEKLGERPLKSIVFAWTL